MSLSFGEVEAMSKKAARGAGYSWGIAEEAGWATRWLCAQSVDGCSALASLLKRGESGTLGKSQISLASGRIQGHGAQPLCPLSTGAALSDHAKLIPLDGFSLGPLAEPVLLMPFLGLIARAHQTTLALISPDFDMCTDGHRLACTGPVPASVAQASLKFGGPMPKPNPLAQRADPPPAAWQTLERFAHRTYAPASEHSRQAGAGPD